MSTEDDGQPKRRGRPALPEAERKAANLKFRTRAGLRQKLEDAAESNEKSLSEEVEDRLERSFQQAELIQAASEAATNAATTAAIAASIKFIENFAGGKEELDFGIRMAKSLSYAKRQNGISDISNAEISKNPDAYKNVRVHLIKMLENLLKNQYLKLDEGPLGAAIRTNIK